jgi:hypothetical protein
MRAAIEKRSNYKRTGKERPYREEMSRATDEGRQ